MRRTILLLAACVMLSSAQLAFSAESGSVEFLNSGKVLPTNLPFSEAVRVDNVLFLSGQIGIAPGTHNLVPGGLKEEARQTMENIRTSLEANGYAMTDLVKCTVMLADIAESERVKNFETPGSYSLVSKSMLPPVPAAAVSAS